MAKVIDVSKIEKAVDSAIRKEAKRISQAMIDEAVRDFRVALVTAVNADVDELLDKEIGDLKGRQ